MFQWRAQPRIFRSIFKSIIDRGCPTLAITFRTLRDELQVLRQRSEMTPYGFKLVGDRSMQNGLFEPVESDLILGWLANADVFVDIGANVGFYSCLARSIGKHVLAVEPLGHNLARLYYNLIENGWQDVEVWPVGLGAHAGVGCLYGGGTGASLIRGWAGAYNVRRHFIALSTLDTILGDRFTGKRMVIKVDVEGSEFGVLKGAPKTLRMIPKPVWLVEITLTLNHPDINRHFLETFAIFWANGYEARTADREQRVVSVNDIETWVKAGSSNLNTHNWLFVPVHEGIGP